MVTSNNQQLFLPLLEEKGISLWLKREDRIHPLISGNKYRKITYNIKQAKLEGIDTLLTFGGAYSNHIAATAYAGKIANLKTIGVIRGEELEVKWHRNPTLELAKAHGMEFKFVSRNDYRLKDQPNFIYNLKREFGNFYLLPEGGTNPLAIKGCEEILTSEDQRFDVICCGVGTGGTLAGIINASGEHQKILGFPVLKGDFLKKDIRNFALKENWELQDKYHFGGYAKVTSELIQFINKFKTDTGVPLDPVYTGKMVFGILHLVQNGFFASGARILAIHTGGLQGIKGMNDLLKNKNLPVLNI